MLLTPLALGSGLVMTSYLVSLPLLKDSARFGTLMPWFVPLLPPVATWVAFVWSYKFIPNRPILWRHAALGSGIAALIFEVAKYGFGFYLIHFPTQEAIYGGFAVMPIFFLWIYLSWLIVLFGAEVVHGLGTFWPGLTRVSEAPG